MNNGSRDIRDVDSPEKTNRFSSGMHKLRQKLGASPRQFAIFGFLLLIVAGLWARPAATLLWHRLRIITGMPRMAVADDDPEEIAKADFNTPEPLDVGRPVELDVILRRDPFKKRSSGVQHAASADSGTASELSAEMETERLERVTLAASSIRLSGTARGLGTALLNDRARVLGESFDVTGLSFRLVEVGTGSVVLEGALPGEDSIHRFRLDRTGAQLISGE